MRRLSPVFPDSLYLRLLYYFTMGRVLHLNNPKTFSEKLQWLKIHQRQPQLTTLVDKLAVKKQVTQDLGSEYVCPVLQVWDKVDDIDISTLPESFVLKTTHSGGNNGVAICKDKSSFDLESAKNKLREAMDTDIFMRYREWPYKNVERKIFAEKYLGDNLVDYKFYCFNGHADCVLLCKDRQEGHVKYYFLDREWHLLPYNADSKNAPKDINLAKPDSINQLFDLADSLSKDYPFVRVDFFEVNGHIYFAEYTFYPASGLDPKKTKEFDIMAGEKIDLSLIPFHHA